MTARGKLTRDEILRALCEGEVRAVEPVAGGTRRSRSLEGCIVHADGSVSDAEFHADILAEDETSESEAKP